ncbi:hypothetical protein RN607_08180 [Demequina capsici]|uniref:Uncharacterized protein n=1 Tax=Demequina capsici TaxID=3075620 RepID=A0AA96JBX1_9MICO|nr:MULTISPECIES: hypothetical protein [unclassified Demequina]WNM23298.1 hypothetical protein RN606_07945 [Demequina sp. OYTSA14]WNM26176.1 hypothetical protein RN607_08180 [Demequina sp. PMTSA13]
MDAPTLTPGSPLAKLGQTAFQYGHSLETLTGTPLEQVQRTARLSAWLVSQGVSPLIISTPSADHAVSMRTVLTEHWIEPHACWVASPPVGTPAFPSSWVIVALDPDDIDRTRPLPDGTEPHVIYTASGILRVVLNHPILGPR